MRRPIDAPINITTEFGVPDSYAKFGRHSGVDYAKGTGSNVYAPTSGTLTQVVSPTGGNMVVIRDNQGFYHRLMHNSQFIKPNGSVSEGELVAKSGTTGLSTGPHVHWDINKEGTYPTSFAAFISPADWLAGKFNQVTPPTGGKDMPIPDQDNYYNRYNKLMLQVRGRNMSREEFRKNIAGATDLQAIERISDNPEADNATTAQQWALANRAALEKQIADLKVALQNEKNKPPQVVIKEVEKIVEKEVIKEVPVGEEEAVRGFFSKLMDLVFRKG